MVDNFGYQPSCELQNYSNFSIAEWLTLLETELNSHRPVLYAGSNTADGHSFVFDGYETGVTGTYTTEFHVNWGWGGTDNGYFGVVGGLNPSGQGSYNLTNQCVVRVQPKSAAPIAYFSASTTTPTVGGSVSFTDLSTNNPTSWSWTFAGGSPSTSTSQNPTNITYANAGLYTVTLTVTNSTGNDIKTVSRMINVGGVATAWLPQDLGFPHTTQYDNRCVSQLNICSPTVAWAVITDAGAATHYPREFAVTSDGGTTWKVDTIKFTNSTNYSIANIDPIDANNAYAAMSPLSEYGGVIVKTTDGGLTWSLLYRTKRLYHKLA